MLRRAFLAAGTLAAGIHPALAADPVKLVVPFPAGGSLDAIGRLLADKLKTPLGAPVIVENRAGANGNIGAAAVAQMGGDGRTLLMGSDGVLTVNPLLYKARSFNAAADLEPVGLVAYVPSLLVVPAASPIRSIADFVATARSRELFYASGGSGSAGHLTMAYFGSVIGAKLTHVPFSGGAPAILSVVGGQVDAAFVALPNALAQVKAGKLRAIAVSSLQRLPQLPEVATVAESGYQGFEVRTAYLLMSSSKLAANARSRLEAMLAAAAASKDFQAHVDELGMQPAWLDARETKAWLLSEQKRWAGVIARHGISAN